MKICASWLVNKNLGMLSTQFRLFHAVGIVIYRTNWYFW